MRTRDRHGRGIRGPMALPNDLTDRPLRTPTRPRARAYFMACVGESIARIGQHCPDVVDANDIGVDEVPDQRTLWNDLGEHGTVPLAAAIESSATQHARIVVYRRPLERRAVDREDLRLLVHETLVEQIVALTGRGIDEIDPEDDR